MAYLKYLLSFALLATSFHALAGVPSVPNPNAFAADTPEIAPSARVVIFRGNNTTGIIYSHTIKIDGEDRATLRRENYAAIDIPAGVHLVKVHAPFLSGIPSISFNLEASPGKTYFFYESPGFPMINTFSMGVKQITASEADELKKTYTQR